MPVDGCGDFRKAATCCSLTVELLAFTEPAKSPLPVPVHRRVPASVSPLVPRSRCARLTLACRDSDGAYACPGLSRCTDCAHVRQHPVWFSPSRVRFSTPPLQTVGGCLSHLARPAVANAHTPQSSFARTRCFYICTTPRRPSQTHIAWSTLAQSRTAYVSSPFPFELRSPFSKRRLDMHELLCDVGTARIPRCP